MNNKSLFSIGDVAKLFHISVSSLRHYENIGLLAPEYIDSNSGYRYYGTQQFEILNTIRYLRALDMPLNEIADFIGNRDIDNVEEKLKKQKKIVIEKQRELKRVEQKINHRLERLSDAQNVPLDVIRTVKLPSCRIVWVENSFKIEKFSDMEAPIRELDTSITEAVIFLGKVGVGISEKHLLDNELNKYDGIFLILDKEDIYDGKIFSLPETDCVQIRFCGSHTEAEKHYLTLLSYIKEHNMSIAGFSREITLIDYGFTNDTEKFVTEISIPVKAKTFGE